MAEAISISLSDYVETVVAKIGEHTYKVRKLGAGEYLDLSAIAEEAQRQQTEILNLRGKYEAMKDASEEEKKKILSELIEGMKPLAELEKRIENIYCGLFDDGEDGRYTRNLVNTVGVENIQKIYAEIIGKLDGTTEEKSA